ncbi:MAG: phasin family protein [Rhodomicrobium sp.]
MGANSPPQIPPAIRELAAVNIDQARAAYAQLLEAARKAQDLMKSIMPSNPVVQGLAEVQERAMTFAQQNLDASFSLANELSKAKDLAEMVQIQSKYAQQQMQAYALQAQELTGLVMNGAVQKTSGGADGAGLQRS